MFFTLLIPGGIYIPYFPLWLQKHGFDPEQIAVILSAPMFLRVVTTPLLTALAARALDRANIYIALVTASAVVSAGYFLTPAYGLVLAVSLLLSTVWTPHSPIADSLALSGVRRFKANYPSMRVWGSISYLLANLAGGFLLAAFSADAVPVTVFASFCLALVAGLFASRLGRPRLGSPLSATEIQAKAHARAAANAYDVQLQRLTTKEDLRMLGVELRGEMAELRSELTGLRTEMHSEFRSVRSEMDQLRNMMRWIAGPSLVGIMATVAGMAALVIKSFA